jgi:phospholipase/carboxylesterase
MPETSTPRRTPRPAAGFSTARLPSHRDRPVRLFVPTDYLPKYAYPLVVLFHPDGADEDAAARLAPLLSRRNYIAACPRGPVELGPGPTGCPRFGWGRDRDADYLRRVMAHVRAGYHVHPRRVYLVGVGEGAAAAYRLGLSVGTALGGVVALNGRLPVRPVKALRGLRVFLGHGANNPAVPVSEARRAARLLAASGADVQLRTYPATQRIHTDMPRDVNRWIMTAVNTTPDLFPNPDA